MGTNNKKSEAEFIESLSQTGRDVYANLVKRGKSRQWLCKKMNTSIVTLNFKMKHDTFTGVELDAITEIVEHAQ